MHSLYFCLKCGRSLRNLANLSSRNPHRVLRSEGGDTAFARVSGQIYQIEGFVNGEKRSKSVCKVRSFLRRPGASFPRRMGSFGTGEVTFKLGDI